ncbi:hypothetical protein [Sedimentitalea todarodis]|uniref:Integrase n=1 Tax=Sedimentitalea todarodis TaxID=1631240 RepID=A0ABU3VL07_9RHOB|nr:hypothetical protein [Sedimentitalea todarodis]MDU9006793.1 hypothetical protein [Sedimentitalea todarodis]
MKKPYPKTPDGRYFLAKDRLWRCTDPSLSDSERRRLVKELMQARLGVKYATTDKERSAARLKVDAAKVQLGERGPVWWQDGAPDVNRYHPKNTVYADWWRGLSDDREV